MKLFLLINLIKKEFLLAQMLADYLMALFGGNPTQRALVREIIRVGRKKNLFEKIQTIHIILDLPVYGDISKSISDKFLKSKEPNYNEKYNFSNIKTIGKFYFSLIFHFV